MRGDALDLPPRLLDEREDVAGAVDGVGGEDLVGEAGGEPEVLGVAEPVGRGVELVELAGHGSRRLDLVDGGPQRVGLGTALDAIAVLTLTVPILLPIALQYDVDPIALGVLMILSQMIGLLTPPVGTVIFVVNHRRGSRAKVTAAIRQLRQTEANIAGLIVNEMAGSEDYDRYYGDPSAADPLPESLTAGRPPE